MAQSVYIETTIISYLAARPSREIVLAGQQQITRDWWDTDGNDFELFTSQLVTLEASKGDPTVAAKRLELLSRPAFLRVVPEVFELAEELVRGFALPRKALRDAEHLSVCAINGIDFLLTWNCTHLANPKMRRRIEDICDDAGYLAPIICTPVDLKGDTHEGTNRE